MYDSGVELYGNILTCSGSQEVIGSIPICSTEIMKQLQALHLVAAFSFALAIRTLDFDKGTLTNNIRFPEALNH